MKIYASQRYFLIGLIGISGFLNGCAQTIFYWGDYEDSLYERYVENDPQQAYFKLNRTIIEAENQKQRAAPGLYADYGFMLFQRGDFAGAVQYFLKEKQQYPESAALMDKLINKIGEKQKSINTTAESHPTSAGGIK